LSSNKRIIEKKYFQVNGTINFFSFGIKFIIFFFYPLNVDKKLVLFSHNMSTLFTRVESDLILVNVVSKNTLSMVQQNK